MVSSVGEGGHSPHPTPRPPAFMTKPHTPLPKTLAPVDQLSKAKKSLIPAPSLSLTECDTSAIAISRRNSTASRFLRLPLDIRYEVYKAILGDKLVHIRLVGICATNLSPWRHVVCQRDHPKHFQAEQQDSLSAIKAHEDWELPHRRCRWETYYNPSMEEGSSYWDDERMHLTILRCSRQTYAEASLMLWSTNTFSIHDHHALKQFIVERNDTQKSHMRKLRLRFDLKQQSLFFRCSFLNAEWMLSLSGLHHLTLILEDDFPARLVHLMALTGKSLTEFGGNRIDAGLENFSLLPLKTAVVEVLSPASLSNTDDALKEAWKREYAEGVRNYLLRRKHLIEPGHQACA